MKCYPVGIIFCFASDTIGYEELCLDPVKVAVKQGHFTGFVVAAERSRTILGRAHDTVETTRTKNGEGTGK